MHYILPIPRPNGIAQLDIEYDPDLRDEGYFLFYKVFAINLVDEKGSSINLLQASKEVQKEVMTHLKDHLIDCIDPVKDHCEGHPGVIQNCPNWYDWLRIVDILRGLPSSHHWL